ncbi:MAG: stage II sporulation protein P [Oscillospiraceae bacterium]|nr:stage II sporulation protein P [Oscillospiraceae bacterium]
MDKDKQALRFGVMALACAFLLRLIGCVFLGNWSLFSGPELAGFMIRSETGRVASPITEPTGTPTEPSTEATDPSEPSEPSEPTDPPETSAPTEPSVETTAPVQLPVDKPGFTAEDAQLVRVTYGCKRNPDLEKLLVKKLSWDLTGDNPTILIIHTHGTESYTQTEERQYEEFGGEYRTDDVRYNMISLGEELARLLTEAGLSVIHDRTMHDLSDYNDSYDNSRAAVQEYLRQYPSIKMVLDLHRDAAEYADGTQWATSATVNGERSAQVMLVVGTNATGLNHPNWETNMSIAEKIMVQMERICAGVARPINLRGSRFNHDLAMGAMIAEIGSAGNTHEEAMRAIPVLANAIISLSKGSQ